MDDSLMFELSIRKQIDEAFEDFKRDLDDFLNGPLPNRHVYGTDVINLYTRKGTHYICGAPIKCLDIATLVVAEAYQNRGLGMRVIDHVHKINPLRCTYVESILNDALYDRLKLRGWRDVNPSASLGDRNLFMMTPLSNIGGIDKVHISTANAS